MNGVLLSEQSLALHHHNQSSSYLMIPFTMMEKTAERHLPSGEGAHSGHMGPLERLLSPVENCLIEETIVEKPRPFFWTYCMFELTTLCY